MASGVRERSCDWHYWWFTRSSGAFARGAWRETCTILPWPPGGIRWPSPHFDEECKFERDRNFDRGRSSIRRDRRPRERRQTGGFVAVDSIARLVTRATGSASGGTMPTGTDLTHRRDRRPRHRFPRGGWETGLCSRGGRGGGSPAARLSKGLHRVAAIFAVALSHRAI